jgi:uncharacterized spore protein YtfJ
MMEGHLMNVQDVLTQARDAMTVRRVFGEPIDKEGLTIVPVANVTGGGGGAGPDDARGGAGGGFALRLTPAGVYVIQGGTVTWQPALNVNRVILGGQLVAISLLLAILAVVRARSAARGGVLRRERRAGPLSGRFPLVGR